MTLRPRQKNELLRISLKKKILIGFAILAAATVFIFHYLSLLFAIPAELILFVILYFAADRWLVRPIEALTLSVIESRHTPNGFVYSAPDIHTGDELELLSDALKRMANDSTRPVDEG